LVFLFVFLLKNGFFTPIYFTGTVNHTGFSVLKFNFTLVVNIATLYLCFLGVFQQVCVELRKKTYKKGIFCRQGLSSSLECAQFAKISTKIMIGIDLKDYF
jgi:hypothetical protein